MGRATRVERLLDRFVDFQRTVAGSVVECALVGGGVLFAIGFAVGMSVESGSFLLGLKAGAALSFFGALLGWPAGLLLGPMRHRRRTWLAKRVRKLGGMTFWSGGSRPEILGIDLRESRVTDEELRRLLSALAGLPALREIRIARDLVSERTVDELRMVLRECDVRVFG